MQTESISIKDFGNWRYEYKYFLAPFQYHQVRSAIQPYMRPDHYTLRTSSGKYLVRSLYFDSVDYRSYHEKIDGNADRIKLRLRTYAKQSNQTIRAELKIRKGVVMEKYGSMVSLEDCQAFIQHKHWPQTENPVLVEFERYTYLKSLLPKVLVEYYREGFSDRSGTGIRITFDHHVRSANARALFPAHPFFKEHTRQAIILEIKCRKEHPIWLRKLVEDHGLRIIASSKFVKAIEVSKPDVVTPSWSC